MAAGPSILEEPAWQERAFVTLSKKGGSDIDFHTLISEMSWSGGAKDVEGQPLMNGGRLTEYSSQEDFEFSATLYMTGVSPDEGTGINAWFYGSDDQIGDDTDGQYEYETTLTRDDFRIAVLFTNDSNVTAASDEVGSGNAAYRWIATNAKLTSAEVNFDDMTLQVEVTFTIPPFDETGSSNVREQEQTTGASSALSSLSSYT